MPLPALKASAIIIALAFTLPAFGQRIQFPEGSANGLRPISPTGQMSPGTPVMVPLNPATQAGIYPAPVGSSATFDPYSTRQVTTPTYPTQNSIPSLTPPGNPMQGQTAPVYTGPTIAPNYNTAPYSAAPYNAAPATGYPGYSGVSPTLPGTGPSGVTGTYPYPSATVYPPSAYPNSAPSALFPGSYPQSSSWWNPFAPAGQPGSIAPPGNLTLPPGTSWGNWNPQGAMINDAYGNPQALRLFQGPRFRQGWIYGSDADDALEIADSDLALAFAIPNFLYSTQPLYLLPSFSLHQWAGPRGPVADLPAIAYSAFLDSGWQSDPTRIFGAELGFRIGMFSDFNTSTSDSLRIMGRAIGRLRITPTATLKAGIIYYDRNQVQMLPALGILCQPNPETRLDLFFPEPKLAHYLSTVGTMDTWWYLGGYYGGGTWTVERTSGTSDSVDINDIRVMLGVEWGRNEQMREGKRYGFFEVGYVFQRELVYKNSPQDNIDLQDSFMIRAGIGY